MSFAGSLVWRERKGHITDCYFCLSEVDGHNSKPKHTVVYPIIPSALRPVEHDYSLQFPVHLDNGHRMKKSKPALLQNDLGPSYSDVDPDTSERNLPHLLSHFELNDLVRDLSLSKLQAELLASHLRGLNLLQKGVKSAIQEKPTSIFVIFLRTAN